MAIGCTVLALTIAACGSQLPRTPAASTGSQSPASIGSPPPVAGLDWTAAAVDQPAESTQQASGSTGFCSPCHSALQTSLGGVAAGPAGLVAVGWYTPPRAVAWRSADGASWQSVEDVAPSDGSALDAVASGATGWLAVGSTGAAPTAWASSDATTWQGQELPTRAAGGDTRQGLGTSVVATDQGWLVGGEIGPLTDPRPAVWRSTAGGTWELVTLPLDGPGSVAALGSDGNGAIVAVGRASANIEGGTAAAWLSTDGGSHWTAAGGDLDAGAMAGVASSSASGWVAVGAPARDDAAAAVWQSRDGRLWRLVPSEPSRTNYGQRIWLTTVASGASGLVAAGWKSDAGNGSAVILRSSDGRSWTRAADIPAFSGGGVASVASVRDGYVAVGSTGWPDNRVATIWISPGR